jgi:hypothetical protein
MEACEKDKAERARVTEKFPGLYQDKPEIPGKSSALIFADYHDSMLGLKKDLPGLQVWWAANADNARKELKPEHFNMLCELRAKLEHNADLSEQDECEPSGVVVPSGSIEFDSDPMPIPEVGDSPFVEDDSNATPREKAIDYAELFVDQNQVRGRPGYDGPGLFEEDYESLINAMIDGGELPERIAWIWTKYYPILKDQRFLDLIEQCKSIRVDESTGGLSEEDLEPF